jgi:hypothetical protein
MRVIRSPEPVSIRPGERSVFLAGSIDMGNTTDWQHHLASSLGAEQGVLLNPRRRQWDASWPTDATSPIFNEQVQWELSAIEAADLVVFYFHPGSQAPVTLLELGLTARTGKARVCCPNGYWCKGNVDVVCSRYQIPVVDSIDQLEQLIRDYCSAG